jgi:hypothetical protein
MRLVRDALAADHPLHFLGLVSSMLYAGTRRGEALGDLEDDRDSALLESLMGVDRAETTALLQVIAAMTHDDLLRAEIRTSLRDRRPYPLPSWLDHLDDATVVATAEWVHVQGDGDDLLIGVESPHGVSFTFVAYVDHNLSTMVKDGFALPFDVAGTLALIRQHAEDDHGRLVDVTPADGQVVITGSLYVVSPARAVLVD